MFEVSCLLSFDLSVDLYFQARDLTEVMSGRRLRNCTNCGQRHYAPSGAKCPHAPEAEYSLANHPDLEDDDSVDLELAALEEIDERPLTPQTPPTPGSNIHVTPL